MAFGAFRATGRRSGAAQPARSTGKPPDSLFPACSVRGLLASKPRTRRLAIGPFALTLADTKVGPKRPIARNGKLSLAHAAPPRWQGTGGERSGRNSGTLRADSGNFVPLCSVFAATAAT